MAVSYTNNISRCKHRLARRFCMAENKLETCGDLARRTFKGNEATSECPENH